MADYMDGKTIDKKIAGIKTRSATLATDIHNVAVSCIAHCQEHRDATKAKRLVDALSKANRPETLKAWFMAYSPIRFNGDGDVKLAKEGTKGYTPFDLDGAAKTPYYEKFREEDAAKQLAVGDVDRRFWALLGTMRKALAGEGTVAVKDEDRAAVQARYDLLIGVARANNIEREAA